MKENPQRPTKPFPKVTNQTKENDGGIRINDKKFVLATERYRERRVEDTASA